MEDANLVARGDDSGGNSPDGFRLAGTFTCEHRRTKDGTGDYWISDKVRPLGLVKRVGKDSSMVLLRQITGAKTKLPPPYKEFDPIEMMRQRQEQRP